MKQKPEKQTSRWKRRLFIGAGTLAIMLGLGYWALNWTTDYVLRSLVDLPAERDLSIGLEEGEESSASSATDSIKKHWPDHSMPSVDERSMEAERLPEDGAANDSLSSDPSGGAHVGSSSSNPIAADPSAFSKVAAVGREAAQDGATETPLARSAVIDLTYSAEVSVDKAKAVEEKITLKEQTKVATTLAKRLTAGEINQIIQFMQGGMSVSEKRQAKDIILGRLSAEEYNDLIQIAAKYGLSQGKSYEESLKE